MVLTRYLPFCLAVLVTAFLFHVPLSANDSHEELLVSALQSLNNGYHHSWSFTETSADSESTTIARYDASRPEGSRWTLLSVDDRVPTDEEIGEFLQEKESRRAAREEREAEAEEDGSVNVRIQVAPGSVNLREESESHYLFEFKPAEDEEEFLEFVDATVRISRPGMNVEFINLESAKPFKPRTGVKVKKFKSHMVFSPAGADGPIVPVSIDTHIQVRAMLVMNIDENQSVVYSDYTEVEDQSVTGE